ncbi:MAG: potassium channel protein [bacterium]
MWLLIGTLGYSIIEGWPLLDSLFMTVITLTTVGYSEVHGLSFGGRIFTILLITAGLLTIGYCMRVVIEYMIDERWLSKLRRSRMEKMLNKLNNHIIVCGYGKIGRYIVNELSEGGISFAVISREIDEEPASRHENVIFVEGDATEEENLITAGVERASVLIAAVGSDADNMFITMTVRGLNPKIKIVARVADKSNENKFLRAGADSVICPYELGGRRIATSVLRPNVTEFLDSVMFSGGFELMLEEVTVRKNAPFCGKSLMDSRIRHNCGTIVLAIRKTSGAFTANPEPSIIIDPGDILVVLGTKTQIQALHRHNKGEKI